MKKQIAFAALLATSPAAAATCDTTYYTCGVVIETLTPAFNAPCAQVSIAVDDADQKWFATSLAGFGAYVADFIDGLHVGEHVRLLTNPSSPPVCGKAGIGGAGRL